MRHTGTWGVALLASGSCDDATPFLERAALGQPTELHIYNLADAHLKCDRLDLAESTLRAGLMRHPESVQLRTLLADALIERRCYSEAAALLSKAIELDAGAVEPVIAMSVLERNSGNQAEAVRQAYLAAAMAPGDERPLAALGAALLESGDAWAALDAFQRAVAIAPENPACYAACAAALLELDRHQDAKSMFIRVLALDPLHFERDSTWLGHFTRVMPDWSRGRQSGTEPL
jgi:tetratricopeptide (TPR) repeat protein